MVLYMDGWPWTIVVLLDYLLPYLVCGWWSMDRMPRVDRGPIRFIMVSPLYRMVLAGWTALFPRVFWMGGWKGRWGKGD